MAEPELQRHQSQDLIPVLTQEEVNSIHMIDVMAIDLLRHMHTDFDASKTVEKRRAATRAGFAAVEGVLWAFRQAAVARASSGHMELSAIEIVGLQEQSVGKKFGKSKEIGFSSSNGNFLKPEESLVLSTHYFTKAYSVFFVHPKEYGEEEFKAYLSAIEIRNRLSHPKSIAEFRLSSNDFDAVCRSFGWVSSYLCDHYSRVLCALWPRHDGGSVLEDLVRRWKDSASWTD